MFRPLRRRWAVAGGLVLAILSAACVQFSPAIAPRFTGAGPLEAPADSAAIQADATVVGEPSTDATAAPARTSPAGRRQTVAVRQGTIAEQLTLGGRVVALEETPIHFPATGRVAKVLVEPGQVVEEGQLLLEAETTEIRRELTAASSRLELDSLRMEQSRAQAQARQRQTEQRVEADRLRRQRAITEAEAGLRRATEDLARVKAGASVADRRAADAAVTAARVSVERAEAELTRASAGPSEAEIKVADQQVWSARLALHRAQNDLERLRSGADSVELRAAEREVTSAQTALDRARLEYERIMRGDPTIVAAAEREVVRAQLALRTAQSTRIESGGSRSAERNARATRDAAVMSARLAVQDAQERLATARRGPPPGEVEMARRAMQTAASDLQTARERYEVVMKGPDELTLAAANQAVEAAQSAAKEAERRFLDLGAGPPPDQVSAANAAVSGARATLSGAMDRLAEINSHPTRAELRAAEDQVIAAQSTLEQAQSEPELTQDEIDTAAYDLLVLERNLEQDRGQVEALERDLMATNLVAPSSGVVSAILVRSGDPLDRDTHVVTLAKQGDRIVTADVSDEDAARLAVGQHATVSLEGATGVDADATILGLVDGPGGIGRVAQLRVSWPSAPPAFASAAQAVVTIQEKADVLLVPQRAVRTSGQRRYVEYMEGETRRTADIVLGITGATDVEVVKGLREGQLVVVGTAGAAPEAPTPAGTRAP